MRSFTRFATWAIVALALVSTPVAWASSHSEAPGTAKDRLADDTDLYAWVALDAPDAVTIVGNWVPLLEPNGGPNFYSFDDEATYYINIDNVVDAQDHIRYEFSFKTTRSNPAIPMAFPDAMSVAVFRSSVPSSRSSWRTPASRV